MEHKEKTEADNHFAQYSYSDLDMNAKYGPEFYEDYTPFAR